MCVVPIGGKPLTIQHHSKAYQQGYQMVAAMDQTRRTLLELVEENIRLYILATYNSIANTLQSVLGLYLIVLCCITLCLQ
jgi:hypothetical protein